MVQDCMRCNRPLKATDADGLCAGCELLTSGLPPVNANRRGKASRALYRAQQGLLEAMRQLEGMDSAEALHECLVRVTRIKERLGR